MSFFSQCRLDWSDHIPKSKPTRRQVGLFNAWVKYLKDSKLTKDEVYRRAASLAESGEKVPQE